MNIEAIKSHLLFYLWRQKDQVTTIGDLKSKMLGIELSSDQVMNSLYQLGYIVYIDKQVQLSEEGKYYMDNLISEETKRIQPLLFENEFDLALLGLFYYRPHLVHMEDIPQLLKKSARQHGNAVNNGNISYAIFELRKYIDNPYTHWYQLNSDGRAYYEHYYAKFKRILEEGYSEGNTRQQDKSTQSSFTKADQQKMNSKLDKVMEMVENLMIGQEVIYTDIIEELNELRQYYNLPKKTWRQLFMGKLSEMTISGVISETISKRIAEYINPEVEKLLE